MVIWVYQQQVVVFGFGSLKKMEKYTATGISIIIIFFIFFSVLKIWNIIYPFLEQYATRKINSKKIYDNEANIEDLKKSYNKMNNDYLKEKEKINIKLENHEQRLKNIEKKKED